MKETLDQIALSLLFRERKTKLNTLRRLIKEGDPEIMLFVLNLLETVAIPNGYPLIIQAMGKSRNPIYIKPLLYVNYKNYSLTIDALINLGAFDQYTCFYSSRKDMKIRLQYAANFMSPHMILQLCELGVLDETLKEKWFYGSLWKAKVARDNFYQRVR